MSEDEDEYLDFAPSKHAVREAFAFCTVAALVVGIIGWAIWTWLGARWGCGDEQTPNPA